MLAPQMTYSIDIQLLGSFGETPLDDLSKLVNLRAVQKPISDARTATYVILSTGSGPGGRWFKSIRPDHFTRKAEERLVQKPGGQSSISSSRLL